MILAASLRQYRVGEAYAKDLLEQPPLPLYIRINPPSLPYLPFLPPQFPAILNTSHLEQGIKAL